MSEKLYAKRNVIALGEHYTRHVSAMTGEGLHDKSSIAAELAWRDRRIAVLKHKVKFAREAVVQAEKLALMVQADYYRAMERVVELEAALGEAIIEIEGWGAYADEYFQRKHDLAGDVARLRAVLNREEGG